MQNQADLLSLFESIKAKSVDPLTFIPDSVMPHGINSDGTVIIGITTNTEGTTRAFRWKDGEGMQDLGVLPDRTAGSTALGVNANGTVIVGSSWNDEGEGRAFCWKEGRTPAMEDLGVLPNMTRSTARGVSDDGTVIVGSNFNDEGEERAFCWKEGRTPAMEDLGVLPNMTRSTAFAVSANGTTIIGECVGRGVRRAFRWKEGRTPAMEDLGVLPGMTSSKGQSMNPDGTVVVGSSWNLNDIGKVREQRAFRWKDGEGMQDLGVLPGKTKSIANDVNADGIIIVGNSWNDGEPESKRGVKWDIGHMTRTSLGEYNTGMGSEAYSLSSDGAVTVGGEVCKGSGSLSRHALRWTGFCGMQDLRVIPGWDTSNAYEVSANGYAVLGMCLGNDEKGPRTFRWTPAGMQNIGTL